ncbi:hypothetical protein JQC91_05715 [Jannaschia sp. Os4]|uniref:hypothetical protein n=1 Tax=Jannaschia sp. Os4 TaxID=2807617 RepID=UPI001939A610|nr:hypothetical protein [Jannaschia sp. Os4]MBM2575798.1 hypothetical protein [Jannaschia sp. Os4]
MGHVTPTGWPVFAAVYVDGTRIYRASAHGGLRPGFGGGGSVYSRDYRPDQDGRISVRIDWGEFATGDTYAVEFALPVDQTPINRAPAFANGSVELLFAFSYQGRLSVWSRKQDLFHALVEDDEAYADRLARDPTLTDHILLHRACGVRTPDADAQFAQYRDVQRPREADGVDADLLAEVVGGWEPCAPGRETQY